LVLSKDLKEYVKYGRAYLSQEENDYFLLNYRGQFLGTNGISIRLKKLAEISRIEKRMYAHLLRHSIATHLLQAGMEIEKIGQFLGHNSLRATEIYTHINHEDI